MVVAVEYISKEESADVAEGAASAQHGVTGILAVQGAFAEHAAMLDRLGAPWKLLRAAEDGDRGALRSVAQAGRILGEAAMAITAVIDPEFLVLGGPIGIHPLLLTQVQETLDELAAAPIRVLASALGENAPLQGALELARGHARANL